MGEHVSGDVLGEAFEEASHVPGGIPRKGAVVGANGADAPGDVLDSGRRAREVIDALGDGFIFLGEPFYQEAELLVAER